MPKPLNIFAGASELPPLTQSELAKWAESIKPVVRFLPKRDGTLVPTPDGDLYYIKSVDLLKTAYTWDPVGADFAEGLIYHSTIKTKHSYAYYGFFKPSIAEVIAQIPKELRVVIVAFEIASEPLIKGDYHVVETKLYTKCQS